MLSFAHPTPLCFLPVVNDYQTVQNTSLFGWSESRFNLFGVLNWKLLGPASSGWLVTLSNKLAVDGQIRSCETRLYGRTFPRQRPRSTCSEKTMQKSGLKHNGTKSPSRSEALRFINSAKSPYVDKMQCFRSARQFAAICPTSPKFFFSWHGAFRPLSRIFFHVLLLHSDQH